jgi:hypothetical protein
MRIDFGYRRNGTRGFVQTLSVLRSPADAKMLAYTAKRVQERLRLHRNSPPSLTSRSSLTTNATVSSGKLWGTLA